MIIESLATIYHSKLADERGKTLVLNALRELAYEAEPPLPLRYEIPRNLNTKGFLDRIISESKMSIAYGI
jgi:hypothetical protein